MEDLGVVYQDPVNQAALLLYKKQQGEELYMVGTQIIIGINKTEYSSRSSIFISI